MTHLGEHDLGELGLTDIQAHLKRKHPQERQEWAREGPEGRPASAWRNHKGAYEHEEKLRSWSLASVLKQWLMTTFRAGFTSSGLR